MATTAMQGLDIYMRSTDEKGAVTYSTHRVWDVDRFVSARRAEAASINEKKSSKKASAEQITREQYQSRR